MTDERPRLIRDSANDSATAYNVFRPLGVSEDSDLDTIQDVFFECMADGIVDDELREAFGVLSAAIRRMLVDLHYFDRGFVEDITMLKVQISEESDRKNASTKEVPMSWEC